MATLHLGTALLHPQTAFSAIAVDPPSGMRVFFGASLWLGLCPPLFAYVGTTLFGWRLGVEPLFLHRGTALAISAAYFVLLARRLVQRGVRGALDGEHLRRRHVVRRIVWRS